MPAKIIKKLLWLLLPNEICLISSRFKTLQEQFGRRQRHQVMTLHQKWPKTTISLWHTVNPVYSYFEKGCRKKCTRQSRMVLWVVFSSLFFKEIWKNGTTRGHGYMSASAEGKQKKSVRQLQCEEQYIDHIPYYLSGLSSAHFSDNLSRNSCITPISLWNCL